MKPFNEFVGRLVTIPDSGTPKQFKCVGTSDVLDNCAVLLFDGRFHSNTVPFERLELVPTQEERTPEHRAGYYSLDFRTSSDEATEWMTFCLMQAAVLFQNVPDNDATREEVLRILRARGLRDDGPEILAATAFYDAAKAEYDRMKLDDEE